MKQVAWLSAVYVIAGLIFPPLPAQAQATGFEVQQLAGQEYDSSIYSKTALTKDIIAGRFSFENDSELSELKGDLERSVRHFKDGTRSLRWRWSQPIPLAFDNVQGMFEAAGFFPGGRAEKYEPAYIPRSKTGGMKLWVYREKPSPNGQLRFGIGADAASALGNPKYKFAMNQNFTGWRALWVHFEEDAKVVDYQGPEDVRALVITPSADMQNDEVYLDLLQFMTFMSKKRHSDLQYENTKDPRRVDFYRVLPAWRLLKKFREAAKSLGKNDLEKGYQGLAEIERRLDYLLGGGKDFDMQSVRQGRTFEKRWRKNVRSAQRKLAALNIKRANGSITGIPLFSSRDEQPAEVRNVFQLASQGTFPELALDYSQNPTAVKRQHLLDAFDYFVDQGWAAGSAVGTVDHMIRINPYAVAAFLLRNDLRKTDRVAEHQQALSWFTRFGEMADINPDHGENSDHIRGAAMPKLISVLLMADGPEKVARMNGLRDYLVHVSNFAPGFSDTIKQDYSIYHHRGAYQNVYGVQGVTTLAMFDWLLRGTAFALPKENTQRLKDVLMAQFNLAGDFELHPATSGRFPYRNSGIDRYMLPGYAFLGVDEEGKVIDEKLAGAFAWAYDRADLKLVHGSLTPDLNYYGTFGTLDLMQKARDATSSAIKWGPPSGHFTFPYAGAATHKRKGWAASVRGMSKYIWDWESGHKIENPYGRYLAFGSLFLMAGGEPLSLSGSGIELAGGFHWGYAPGATTKALKMDDVIYEIRPSPKYVEGHHRNFTDQAFLGGVSHAGQGLFAMSLQDTVTDDIGPLFDDSFRAKKSYFFVDNEIIMLGSGISNDDRHHHTITTLFQHKLGDKFPAVAQLDGDSFSADGSRTADGGFLRDPQGNYYIVPKGQFVVFDQSEQQSLVTAKQLKGDLGGKRHIPVSALHAKAWIDHGTAPKEQGYEYQILVKGDEATAKRLKARKSYTVHQKNEKAHIVEHQAKGIFAYALFEPARGLPGHVRASDTAVLAMAGERDGGLLVSVTDPDLRLGDWPNNMSAMPFEIVNQRAGEHVATLRLKGAWKLKKPHADVQQVSVRHGVTILQIRLDHGLTRELMFVHD